MTLGLGLGRQLSRSLLYTTDNRSREVLRRLLSVMSKKTGSGWVKNLLRLHCTKHQEGVGTFID